MDAPFQPGPGKTMRAARMARLMALALVMSLAGCSRIGPDFTRPETPVSGSWLDGQKGGSQTDDFRSWWSIFQDEALNRLIHSAYRQNLDIRMAAIRILEARVQLGIAKSFLFPQTAHLQAETLYEQLSQQSPHNQDLRDFNFPYYQTGFDTAWELDIWGRFRRGIESSAAELAVKALDYDDILVSLTAETASAYIQIRTFQERLALARANAQLQDRSYRIADSQFRNGLNTELDMQQAKALRQQTLAEIANLETGLRQTRNGLCLLLGMPPSQLERELGGDEHIPAIEGNINVGIPAEMLRRRPDVRREEFRAAAQSAHIGIAESELLPRLTLVGSVGFATGSVDGIDALNALSPSGLAGKVGPTITWPVLQFGRLKNNVRAQDARFEELLAGYRKTVLNALKEVEDALIGYRKADEQVTILREGVAASQRAAELSLMQYQNGLEDYTRVLNSQLFLVQQQDRLTALRGDTARYLVAMYKALGGGWQIRQGQPLLPPETRKAMMERTDWGSLLEESEDSLDAETNPTPGSTGYYPGTLQ